MKIKSKEGSKDVLIQGSPLRIKEEATEVPQEIGEYILTTYPEQFEEVTD